jgi:outer membrane protein assembly factor BamB
MTLLLIISCIFLVTGCSAPETTDPQPTLEPTPAGPPSGQSTAVIATVADDYSVGALATMDLQNKNLEDNLTTVSSDPVVVTDEGWVFVINRYHYDSIRVYAPGEWNAPRLEFSTGDLSNPQDVDICAGNLFVTMLKRDYLGVYEYATGLLVDTVDLSAFDDGDGSPEASTMVEVDGKLYIGLEQFDENNGWTPAGGTVIEVDCASRELLNAWKVGNAPTVHENPSDPDTILIRTGVFFNQDYSIALDGDIYIFNIVTGKLSDPLVSETDLEANLGPIVATSNGRALFISSDESWNYALYCLDLSSGDIEKADTTDSYLASISINDRGEAWIAARAGFASPESPGGIMIYDVDGCKSLTGKDLLTLSLPPYSIAFY